MTVVFVVFDYVCDALFVLTGKLSSFNVTVGIKHVLQACFFINSSMVTSDV